jgi:hypothetical protein
MLIILIFTSETLNYTIMKAIIAIVCKESESINMFFFPLAISKKMKDYKDGAICFVEKDNLPDARYYLALDLIEEKHISKIDTDLIIAGKIHEINIKGLNISIRTGNEMKSFMKYYNCLP